MSIQQAMNNMLFSAQVGAGLYAQSPAAKTQAKIKGKEKAIEAEKIKADVETGAHEGDENATFEKTYFARTKKIAKLEEEMFELNPTEKRYQSYLTAVKEKEQAKTAYKDRVKFLKEQKKEQEKEKLKGGKK